MLVPLGVQSSLDGLGQMTLPTAVHYNLGKGVWELYKESGGRGVVGVGLENWQGWVTTLMVNLLLTWIQWVFCCGY